MKYDTTISPYSYDGLKVKIKVDLMSTFVFDLHSGQYYFKKPIESWTIKDIIEECEKNTTTVTRIERDGRIRTKWDTRTIWII